MAVGMVQLIVRQIFVVAEDLHLSVVLEDSLRLAGLEDHQSLLKTLEFGHQILVSQSLRRAIDLFLDVDALLKHLFHCII